MIINQSQEKFIQGVGVSSGIIYGPVFVFLKTELKIPYYKVEPYQAQSELQNFKKAIEVTKQQLVNIQKEIIQKVGTYEANIFDAHLLLLEDKSLLNATLDAFHKQQCNIAYCFNAVIQRLIQQFSTIEDVRLKERCLDLKDIARRVLQNLLGHQLVNLSSLLKEPRIVVTNNLDPSDAANFSQKQVQALLLESGSKTCHAAIMARSFGIPAIVNIKDICQQITGDSKVLLDGDEGKVFINPSPQTLMRYGQLQKQRDSFQLAFENSSEKAIRTKDGTEIELWLNYDEPMKEHAFSKFRCKGIGLVRTENFFLKGNQFLTEDEQVEIYKAIAQKAQPFPVVIRTVDIGGDKIPKNMSYLEEEKNPFLGLRGIRFCLSNPDLFLTQLRAILRASVVGNIRILYPMITNLQELTAANQLLQQCKQALRDQNVAFNEQIHIGAMIETPSAAVIADLLAPHCDFLSIGTSDLIQYTLAVDRTNERIAHLYETTHPSIVRFLKNIAKVGQSFNKPIYICGELASDPISIIFGMSLGIHAFCTHQDKLAEIQYLIQQCTQAELDELKKKCSLLADSAQIFALYKNFYLKKLNEIAKK